VPGTIDRLLPKVESDVEAIMGGDIRKGDERERETCLGRGYSPFESIYMRR
jgi:hypothetical protein